MIGGLAPGECHLRLVHVDGTETGYRIVVQDAPAPAGPRRVPAEEHQVRAFTLGVGEVLTVPAAGIASFSSSGPDLVDLTVSPDGASLIVRGIAVGHRTVFVVFVDGHAERYTFEVR